MKTNKFFSPYSTVLLVVAVVALISGILSKEILKIRPDVQILLFYIFQIDLFLFTWEDLSLTRARKYIRNYINMPMVLNGLYTTGLCFIIWACFTGKIPEARQAFLANIMEWAAFSFLLITFLSILMVRNVIAPAKKVNMPAEEE